MCENARKKKTKNNNKDKNPHSEETIIMAACGDNETLPMNPDLPADLFTSCLTTPMKTAFKLFAKASMLSNVTGYFCNVCLIL